MGKNVLIKCIVPCRDSRGSIEYRLKEVLLRLPLRREDRLEMQRRIDGYLER